MRLWVYSVFSTRGHYFPVYLPAALDEYIRSGLQEFNIDSSIDWQINVHQYRVIVDENIEGVSVPEGIHCDGHDRVMICVFERNNISGGEMKLFKDIEGDKCFHKGIVEKGQAALLNDRMMFHYVSNIEPVDKSESSYRDVLVVAISKWDERWYGEAFDKKAIEDA